MLLVGKRRDRNNWKSFQGSGVDVRDRIAQAHIIKALEVPRSRRPEGNRFIISADNFVWRMAGLV